MTIVRRSAAMAAALLGYAGAVVGAGPASAVPVVAFKAPAQDEVVKVSNTTIGADISSATGTLEGNITLIVDWTEGSQDQVAPRVVTANGQPSQSVSFPVTLPFNGSYVARIQATDSGVVGSQASAERRFFAAAPPAVPTGVRAALGSAGSATVSWDRNPEPDIVGYRVERSAGDGPFSPVGTTRETTLADRAPPVGNGGYRVVALRRGARPGDEVASAPSSRVTPGGGGAGKGGPPARLGKANLSKFDKLLADAKAQGAPAGPEPTEDGAFDPNLPFGGPAAGEAELGSEEQPGPGGATLPYVAGGLLVLAAFLLLRSIRAQANLPPGD